VVRWDAPGYARSADAETAPGIDGYAAVVAELIRRLAGAGEHGDTAAAHVLGVSWGGVIALRWPLATPSGWPR